MLISFVVIAICCCHFSPPLSDYYTRASPCWDKKPQRRSPGWKALVGKPGDQGRFRTPPYYDAQRRIFSLSQRKKCSGVI